MNISAQIQQLVRAHYSGSESGFLSAAEAIARCAKVPRTQEELLNEIRRGRRDAEARQRRVPPPTAQQQSQQPRSLSPFPPQQDSEFLQPMKAVTFAELLVSPEIQVTLDEIVTELDYREQLAERGLTARSRILFHGPPGNGKSSLASAIAQALGLSGHLLSLPSVVTGYLGGTGSNLGRVLRDVNDGTLICFDEIDAIGASRSGGDSGASKEQNAIVNTLLTQLDANTKGVIVATTNRLDILDDALVRRFDEVIRIPAPSNEQLISLARQLEAKHGVPPVDIQHCTNFDAVTKSVLREARRYVMAQIRAEESAANGKKASN